MTSQWLGSVHRPGRTAAVVGALLALVTIAMAGAVGPVRAQDAPPAPDWLAFTTRPGKGDQGLDCTQAVTAAGRAILASTYGPASIADLPEGPAFTAAHLARTNGEVVPVAGTEWARFKADRGTITRITLDVPQGGMLDYLTMLYPEQVGAGARVGLEIRNATRLYGAGVLGAGDGLRQGAWLETETGLTLRGRSGPVSPVTARIVLIPPIEGYRHATDGELAPGSDRFVYSDADYSQIGDGADLEARQWGRQHGRRAFDPSPWQVGLVVDARGADREVSALFAWLAPWRHDSCAATDVGQALGATPTVASATPTSTPVVPIAVVTTPPAAATPRTAPPPTAPTPAPATPARTSTPVAPSQPSQGGYTVTSGFITRQVGFECQSEPQTRISAATLGPDDGVGLVLGNVLGSDGQPMQNEVRILTIGPNGQVWENRGASPPHCFRVLGRFPGGTIVTGAMRADVYVGTTLIKTYAFTVTP